MRHPHHDLLSRVVQLWYMQADPDMGYQVDQQWFGVCQSNLHARRYGLVTLNAVTPSDVPLCIRDIRRFYNDTAVMIVVDDRALAAILDRPLLASGCGRGPNEVFLAHVGVVPAVPVVPGVVLEPVTKHTLVEYVVTKIKAFRNSETPPWPSHVDEEVALRAAEINGEGRLLLARCDGEPAAVAGWYDDHDLHIFHLATRVPFRNQGIARYMLCSVLANAYARGCRSVIINADPDDTPIQLYRRLGFTHEVYWRRRYYLFPEM